MVVSRRASIDFPVLVSTSTTAILAAKQATTTIPIVMVTNVDPVATGIVESLARPGGNSTGLTRLTRELTGKRLELLQAAVPTLSRVGVLVETDAAAQAHLSALITGRSGLALTYRQQIAAMVIKSVDTICGHYTAWRHRLAEVEAELRRSYLDE